MTVKTITIHTVMDEGKHKVHGTRDVGAWVFGRFAVHLGPSTYAQELRLSDIGLLDTCMITHIATGHALASTERDKAKRVAALIDAAWQADQDITLEDAAKQTKHYQAFKDAVRPILIAEQLLSAKGKQY